MASIRGTFQSQLDSMDNRLLRMGSLTDEAIERAIRALTERDSPLAVTVIRGDSQINDLRYEVEEQAYTLLATQQPLAGDLRRVASAISIATNLERMADHASGIAVLARRLNKEPELRPILGIPRMAELARGMLRRSLDSYLTSNAELARQVAEDDVRINQLNEQALRELLAIMIEDPRTIRRATYLLWVTHNLERIGDRTKNICERVVYVVTGRLSEFHGHSQGEDDGLDEHDSLAGLDL